LAVWQARTAITNWQVQTASAEISTKSAKEHGARRQRFVIIRPSKRLAIMKQLPPSCIYFREKCGFRMLGVFNIVSAMASKTTLSEWHLESLAGEI
jgi:hypothetical protein